MKKLSLKIAVFIIGLFMIFAPCIVVAPAFADCYKGTILSANCSDPDDPGGIKGILKTVVNIMFACIAGLAVVGIVVTGIQYLTSGGNEEKATKAKRRLFEIVIGLAAFALMYAVLSWLLPGFQQP